MAQDQLSDTFNPFGLTDSRTLEARRRAMFLEQSRQMTEGMSGMDKAGAVAGQNIGLLLGKIAQRAGIVKDHAGEAALAVDEAAKTAQETYAAIPDEERKTDAFGIGIQRRQKFIEALDAQGLHTQADKVRQQMVELREQQTKFRKMNAEADKAETDADAAEIELDAVNKGLREKDELTRLQNSYDLLDPTDPIQAARADQIQARIDKITTIVGTTENDPSASDKVTVRKVEQSLFENQSTLDGFMQSAEAFDPSFQTLMGQVKNYGFKVADIIGMDLPDEIKQELTAFTTHKQRTSMNLNAYIKAITGAQMSNPEAIRLKKDVPTMDDSPTEYKTKMDNTIAKLQAIRARSLDAMAYVDDRQKFLEVMTTPLEQYIPEKSAPGTESDEVNAANAALERLEAQLGQ